MGLVVTQNPDIGGKTQKEWNDPNDNNNCMGILSDKHTRYHMRRPEHDYKKVNLREKLKLF